MYVLNRICWKEVPLALISMVIVILISILRWFFFWVIDWLVLPFCSIGSFSIGEFAWLGHVVGSFGWHVWLVNSVDSHD